MKKKYQMTGCAKFFVVIMLLAPLAYIGASYYNGQDGIQNFKSLLGLESKEQKISTGEANVNIQADLVKAQKDAQYFEREVQRLQKELEACQKARQN
jgi:hypothetical protein